MPSIEIICIGQCVPVDFSNLPFAVESGTELKSHRRPRPLFQEDFAKLRGCIYHLGNPDLKLHRSGRCFFAYHLLSEAARNAASFLEFLPEFVPGTRTMLTNLVWLSPVHEVLFTTDWQFGPDHPYRSSAITLDEFWSLHDSRKLLLNAAYPIR